MDFDRCNLEWAHVVSVWVFVVTVLALAVVAVRKGWVE